MDVTAECVADLVADLEAVSGLRFTYEPEELRFFQARFEAIG
jgi:tryptophanase